MGSPAVFGINRTRGVFDGDGGGGAASSGDGAGDGVGSAGAASVTVTVTSATPSSPSSSATVSVAVYSPGSLKECCTVWPSAASLPSPKSHEYVSTLGADRSSNDCEPSNVIA